MTHKLTYRLSAICLLLLLGAFYGCAGREYAPQKNGVMYVHKELPAADRAVEAARAAGKDKECPAEFAAAEKMKNDAYTIYWECRTAEAIAMANEATARANALCPRRAEAPPPPAAAAPTVSIWADPATIEQGQCTKLAWSTTGASSASIDRGIGSMDPNGSRQVCPASTTQYTATAMGEGGTRTASTTVTVNPAPAPPPPPPVKVERKVIDRLVLHVNFDFDKSVVRPADVAELQKAIAFLKKYPANDVAIEGHTDSRGTDKYNQALSERRAAAVKAYLLKHGEIDSRKDTITTTGLGESKPIADNKTDKGRFENRRVEILILEK